MLHRRSMGCAVHIVQVRVALDRRGSIRFDSFGFVGRLSAAAAAAAAAAVGPGAFTLTKTATMPYKNK